jgi:hypothetical protein
MLAPSALTVPSQSQFISSCSIDQTSPGHLARVYPASWPFSCTPEAGSVVHMVGVNGSIGWQ